jgi:hypothetical protein
MPCPIWPIAPIQAGIIKKYLIFMFCFQEIDLVLNNIEK